MEVAVLGGTGDVGGGLVVRWGADAEHDLVVGSRVPARATAAAEQYRERIATARADGRTSSGADGDASEAVDTDDLAERIVGRSNEAAAVDADVVVAAVPPEHLAETISDVADALSPGAVVVSPAVALDVDDDGAHYDQPGPGSYTAVAAEAAPDATPVVGAFHTLSARRLADLDRSLDIDTPVVGGDPAARRTVAALAEDVAGIRAVDAGPVANAAAVEALTPLLITLGRYDEALDDPGVRFA